jgi:hypothetical protein
MFLSIKVVLNLNFFYFIKKFYKKDVAMSILKFANLEVEN